FCGLLGGLWCLLLLGLVFLARVPRLETFAPTRSPSRSNNNNSNNDNGKITTTERRRFVPSAIRLVAKVRSKLHSAKSAFASSYESVLPDSSRSFLAAAVCPALASELGACSLVCVSGCEAMCVSVEKGSVQSTPKAKT